MPKQTYYCKCGKTFQKNSSAQDTGLRMTAYDSTHECFGCPFIEVVREGWGESAIIKAYECRASMERVKYTTQTDCSPAQQDYTSDWVAHVYTLDFDWLERFIADYLKVRTDSAMQTKSTLAERERGFRSAGLCHGRRSYGFDFAKNKAGRAAKVELFESFFSSNKTALTSLGVAGDRQRILDMIERMKATAKEEHQKVLADADADGTGERAPASPASPEPEAVNGSVAMPAQEDEKVSAREAAPIDPTRGITEITAEICFYKAQTVQNIIEIGKRLIEAKEMLQHGEWGEWLKTSVEFSHRTATNFINVATQFSNWQPVANLPYTNLIALLGVPEDSREDFLGQPHEVDGELKTVDEMSKRELERVIRERDEEKQRADRAQRLADEACRKTQEADQLAKQLSGQLTDERLRARQELDDMKDAAHKAARREVAAQFAQVNRVAEEKIRETQELRQQLLAAQATERGGFSEDVVFDAADSFHTMVSGALEGFRAVLQVAEPHTRVDALEGALMDIKSVVTRMQDELTSARSLAENETEESE